MFQYITMDSEYCSMGRWISVIVGHHTNMKLYEGKDLIKLADEPWLTEDYLQAFDEKLTTMTLEEIKHDKEMKQVHEAMKKAILKAVSLGPCIIHERAAGDILKDRSDCLKALLYNTNIEHKIPRTIGDSIFQLENPSRDDILRFIEKEDKKRYHYRNAVSPALWGDKTSYDLCLDSDVLSREKCAEILIETVKGVSLNLEECAEIIKTTFS